MDFLGSRVPDFLRTSATRMAKLATAIRLLDGPPAMSNVTGRKAVWGP